MLRLSIGAAAALALGACNTTVDVSDFDRSCAVASDCVAVPGPEPCTCSCEAVAVNVHEEARYLDEWNARRDACTNAPLCGPCPALPTASCQAGTCAVP